MDATAISRGITSKPLTPNTRQASNVSAKSRSSVGSPRVNRKVISVARETTPSKTSSAIKKTPITPVESTSKARKALGSTTSLNSTKSERTTPKTAIRKQSADSTKKESDAGAKRLIQEKKNMSSTPTMKATARTPKTVDAVKRTRDVNRNSPRERPIRSDSNDTEAASKLINVKVGELRARLSTNTVLTASLSDFIKESIDTFVVLPLGRFSRNSSSLWKVALMELLIEITTPTIKVILDPTLIELEKESLRIHSFHDVNDLPDGVIFDRSIRGPGTTLFFMPGKDLEAVENLLTLNEDKLGNVLLICHSLKDLSRAAEPSSIVHRTLPLAIEEDFHFDLFPDTAYAPVFSELRGHRFLPMRQPKEIRASSLDYDVEPEITLKTAVSAPNLFSEEQKRVPTAFLTIGAICCGAGLAWMFMSKR